MSLRGSGIRGGGLIGSLLLAALVAVILFADSGDEQGPGGAGSEQARAAQTLSGVEVTRIVDGDTIEVSIDGETDEVRYIGIDTPESVKPGSPVECFGRRASALNERLVGGRSVRLVFDRELRDVYGRLLAYVYVDGRFVNATLVRRGYARTLTISPNTAHAGLFHRLARAAGREGRGLWAVC